MSTDTDTYIITVEFSRSLSDDTEVCAATNRTRVEQLVAELQEACDEGILVGSFKITRSE